MEVKKATAARVIVLLVEGEQVAYANADDKDLPKNFFEALVKTNWRRWVEAVKKELTGWDANNAVSVVDIKDVPKNAKVVPLGELYSIKRDGRFKYRQYLTASARCKWHVFRTTRVGLKRGFMASSVVVV